VNVGGISVFVGVMVAVCMSEGNTTFVEGINGVLELTLVASTDSLGKTGIA
jgi:hypothetical protein